MPTKHKQVKAKKRQAKLQNHRNRTRNGDKRCKGVDVPKKWDLPGPFKT